MIMKRTGVFIVAFVGIFLLLFVLHPVEKKTTKEEPVAYPTVQPSVAVQEITPQEKMKIDAWIRESGLNDYGDPKKTIYTGGTPLFDDETATAKDRYLYIRERHPDAPWEY